MKPLTLKEWLENLRGAMQAQWEFCNGCKYHDHPCYILDEDDNEWIFEETWCNNSGICNNGDKFEDIPTLEEVLKEAKKENPSDPVVKFLLRQKGLHKACKKNPDINSFFLRSRKEQRNWNFQMIVDIIICFVMVIVVIVYSNWNLAQKLVFSIICSILGSILLFFFIIENIQLRKVRGEFNQKGDNTNEPTKTE